MRTSFYNAKYLRTPNVKLSFCTLTTERVYHDGKDTSEFT